MVEYALIIALLALVCVGAIALATPAVSSLYAQVAHGLAGMPPADPTATPGL